MKADAPGYVVTVMVRAVAAVNMEKIIANMPIGRQGKPEAIARSV